MESTVTTTDSHLAGTGNHNLSRTGAGMCPSIPTTFEGMNEATMQADLTDEPTRAKTGIPTWKRCFDISLLILSAPFWLPVCLVIALVIRLGSRGPILFKQERIGQGGRVFICYKFRTMRLNAPQSAHQKHVKDLIESSTPMIKLDAENDGRLIRGGSWIRASGLDELAQLTNIVRGEMSFVGPRPCIPYEYAMYQPWQRRRCAAPPGLTGLWQVSGKNHTTFSQMVHLDIQYARKMSVWLDISILVRTPLVIVQQVLEMRAPKRARYKSAE